MECTQRLDFECSQVERICPEQPHKWVTFLKFKPNKDVEIVSKQFINACCQIGFLGILGTKYPVKRGPNKIGRDPHTCSIVLNKNSISRQHAVINVLNGHNYMLMDLDSANKTKLNNKSLQAYIPVPLTNGDTVQFGEVFGIFRLLEEETDLPCTQAIDIPDTPVSKQHASRVRQAIVPESPDVSDKDDSFIVPSQPKTNSQFKSPSNKFIKPSARTVTVPSIGSNKIENIFWSSSKKSNSFNLEDSNVSLNESDHNGDIHETEAQTPSNGSTDSIYTAETQLPTDNASPSIHSLNTQLPVNNLPSVCKINNQHEVELDLYTAKKVNENNVFDAETQYVTHGRATAQSIFEANTQLPEDALNSPNSGNNIFEANTQFPFDKASENNDSGNLFDANTQMPFDKASSEDNKLIFDANTQFPFEKSSKNSNSDNIFETKPQLPFESSEKNTADNSFEANTQLSLVKTPESKLLNEKDLPNTSRNDSTNIQFEKQISDKCMESNNKTTNKKPQVLNKSDNVIMFNDLETQDFLDEFQSQPILGSDFVHQDNEEEIPLSQSDTITDEDIIVDQGENSDVLSQIKPMKRNIRIQSGGSSENIDTLSQVKPTKKNICIESDESTDCEDIDMLPTQKIPAKPLNEDDLTDCEGDLNILTNKNNKPVPFSPKIDFEDLATQVIPEIVLDKSEDNAKEAPDKKPMDAPCFEDMPTQVILEDNVNTNIEDMPTQVIQPDIAHKPCDSEALQFSEEIVSPFKVPFQTPIRAKRKDGIKAIETTTSKPSPTLSNFNTIINNEDDERYYAATQEILEDLCSQKNTLDSKSLNNKNKHPIQLSDDEVVSGSVENYVVVEKCPDLDNEVPVKKLMRDNSTESSDGEDKVNKFVTNLTAKQISDVIGVNIAKPKKVPSDPSDVEVTPKKLRPFTFMYTELPDSQEIKTSVSLSSRTIATESSSESETEKESQEQTPIVFRKKKRVKRCGVKKDLSTKFDVQALPTRIITRARKPTSKILESDAATRKRTNNILKPKYLTEQDDEVDTDIISENITRLRSKNDKKSTTKVEEKSAKSTNKIENPLSIGFKPTEKRSTNKKHNKKDVIDLTQYVEQTSSEISKLDDKGVKSFEAQEKSGKTRSNKEKKSEDVDAKSKSKRKSDEIDCDTSKLKPRETRRKKETQEKITNYTISKVSNGDESKVTSTSKVDESLDSTADTSKSTRSTRNKKVNNDEKKSVMPEQDTTKSRRGRPRKDNGDKSKEKKEDEDDKKQKIDETDKAQEEQPIRRSKRQKTVKELPEKSDSQPKVSRTHEQSTVYNISSESGADSPKALKRSATLDVDVPSPKRTRSVVSISSGVTSGVTSTSNCGVNSNSSSLRSTPRPSRGVKTQHVLFTAFPCEEVKGKLEKLGAVVVSDVMSCSVVLTLSLRRTFKLLCAVGLGRPIVGPQWMQACVDNNTIIDPWQFLLKDETSETRFKFTLARTLAGPRNYLRGYNVSATPKVLPSAPEMKLIVECSGGAWGEREGGAQWVAVTCAADRQLWAALRLRGAVLVSAEFILTGVLRQQLDVHAYLIK